MDYKSLIKDFLNEMWNVKNNDLEELHDLFSRNVIINSPLGKNLGKTFIEDVNLKWDKAFPDMTLSSIDLICQDNKVVSTWISRCTNHGPFNGFEPSHKLIVYKGVTIFEFDRNKVVNYSCFINLCDIYHQLGFYFEKEKYDGQSRIMQDFDLLMSSLEKMGEGAARPTRKELICLSCWVTGKTAKEIGLLLDISHRTVESHIARVMAKIECHSKSELLSLLEEKGFLYLLMDLYRLCFHKKLFSLNKKARNEPNEGAKLHVQDR